jgi:acetyl-CoA acyltransferase
MTPFGAPGRRVAIVAGVRTPFARSGTLLADQSALDLGKHAVASLVARTEVRGRDVDLLVFGTVLPSILAPNIAREIALLPHFPRDVQAHSVSRACASANQAITDAADQIALGHARVAIAGGAESLTQVPILHSHRMSRILVRASKAKTATDRVTTLASIRPRDLVPITPTIAEPSTGETMGESADTMAKLNGITREAQDAFALRSHQRAAMGAADGRLSAEIAPMLLAPRTNGAPQLLSHDNGIRADTTLPQLQALRPVFDKRYGSITAGNASPLTDGGAAVLLMREDVATALGYTPLGFIRSYAYAAIDPAEQLLQAPVFAAPKALERAGVTLADIAVVEMHEAFAAQVLSNVQGLASRTWGERAGLPGPVGEIDPERLNVMGGSIAIGHPFGATGARVLTTLLNELNRRNGQFGLMTVCAAGGLGHAMVVERA